MFLKTNVTNRRRFLERSVLGAGSLLFAPLLFDGCTDHLIPNPPTNPTNPPQPPSAAYSIDWNDAAKTAVSAGLGAIPGAGEILAPLCDILWPDTQEDVWGEIKAQVEALIDQKISDLVYQQVSDDLIGLRGLKDLYLDVLNDEGVSGEHIYENWLNLRAAFVVAQPHFQSPGYEFLLLPLFVQFTNLYLIVLQDGARNGLAWGLVDGEVGDINDALINTIRDFTTYTDTTFLKQRASVANGVNPNAVKCETFRTKNTFDRSMTRAILDYRDLWQYFDPLQYPVVNGVGPKVVLTREIYSDPFGSCTGNGGLEFDIVPPWATQLPTNLTVWGYDRIDAVQLTYPANSGPGGVTQTGRMGDPNGGTNQPPRGGVFDLTPDNPIILNRAYYGDIVNALEFYYYDRTTTGILGGGAGLGSLDSAPLGLAGLAFESSIEALSSIRINGEDPYYHSADVVIFGTQRWQSPPATLNAVRNIYIKSPKERSAADFAKAFPKLGITAALITEELKAARKDYWAKLKARAAKLK